MKNQLADPWVRCVGQDEQPAVFLGPCESGEEPLPEQGASVIDRNISRTAEAALRPDKVWALAGAMMTANGDLIISTTAAQDGTSSDHALSDTPPAETIHPFDARGVARRFRHAAIFGALDVLTPGEAMRFLNDHDPLPLLRQIADRYGETFEIAYRHRSEQGVMIDILRLE